MPRRQGRIQGLDCGIEAVGLDDGDFRLTRAQALSHVAGEIQLGQVGGVIASDGIEDLGGDQAEFSLC